MPNYSIPILCYIQPWLELEEYSLWRGPGQLSSLSREKNVSVDLNLLPISVALEGVGELARVDNIDAGLPTAGEAWWLGWLLELGICVSVVGWWDGVADSGCETSVKGGIMLAVEYIHLLACCYIAAIPSYTWCPIGGAARPPCHEDEW